MYIITHQLDAVEWLRIQPDRSINLIVTDPAYESLEKHRKGAGSRLKEWFEIFPNSGYLEFFQESYRALAKNSHMYVMCDQTTGLYIKPIAESVGFKFWKFITWDKQSIGMGYHYRNRTEWIAFFEKGKRKLNDFAMPDILSHKRIRNGYPTEKPHTLYSDLIRQSTSPGEIVADPFFGSGNSLVVATSSGRQAIGTDTSSNAHSHLLAQAERRDMTVLHQQ